MFALAHHPQIKWGETLLGAGDIYLDKRRKAKDAVASGGGVARDARGQARPFLLGVSSLFPPGSSDKEHNTKREGE
jgi:hypothetical protein